jgi:hypothetical protein
MSPVRPNHMGGGRVIHDVFVAEVRPTHVTV